MSNAATMTSLLTRLQAEVDRTFSTTSFVTTAQAQQWLNDGLSRIHYLIASSGEDYLTKAASPTTLVAGTSAYALPSDFFKVKGVDLAVGGYTYDVDRYMPQERNRLQSATANGPGYFYRIQGTNIVLIPTPGAGTLTVNYVPTFTAISGSTHVNDSVPDGWEEYAVNYAAAQCRRKAEEDSSDFDGKAAEWWATMVKFLEPRDQLEPMRIVDKYRRWDRDPWDSWRGSH